MEKKATIIEHLQELRRVIIISMLAIIIGTTGSFLFLREPLMAVVFSPIRHIGKELVIIGVAEGFLVQLKLACIGGIILASPVVLWQVMGFTLPALYSHERKLFLLSFFVALFLFITGVIFGYLFVIEFGLRTFLLGFAQEFTAMISASRYLSFFISFLLPFGLVFEIPLVVYLLTRLGLITADLLRRKRGYAILGILIVAAILTPPDVLSQIMLTIPMLLLYEISILLAVLVERKKKSKEQPGNTI
jgi:sec-independent protein translocase protein TatC